eukprot:CAMPEP_0172944006 /NCGR_PEP_ID=MMETSP1075-20121228/225832_1 /TAXON_ID=2916 /ORGANISM="Ceratium fusus, Strain PA161109" /LENGTH=317 /DNA_ID=CAMNT_0013805433 /DNA_START=179 /DNA_END=1129 /DNA_ORIENTATION=-
MAVVDGSTASAQAMMQRAMTVKATSTTKQSRLASLLCKRHTSCWKEQVLRDWALQALSRRLVRRKRGQLSCLFSQEDRALLLRTFLILAGRSFRVMARRVALRTSFRTSDSITQQGMSQLAMLLFCTWAAELRANRAEAARLKARELADHRAALYKKRVLGCMQELMGADVPSLARLALNEWLTVAQKSRMKEKMAKLEAATTRQTVQQDKLVRAKAAAFFGRAHGKLMHKAVFLAWVTITQEAVVTQKTTAIENPPQHQPCKRALSQWLQFSIDCVAVERGRLLLPEVLGAWQRSTWHVRGLHVRLRKTALHIGNG